MGNSIGNWSRLIFVLSLRPKSVQKSLRESFFLRVNSLPIVDSASWWTKMTKPFYAVRVGRTPGVYRSWPECFAQINGFPKAAFKKFQTLPEAEDFLRGKDTNRKPGFYAVRNGRVPGIYLTWAECQNQITNYPKPSFKKFPSIEEAQQFVNGFDPSRVSVEQATTSYFPGLFTGPGGVPQPCNSHVAYPNARNKRGHNGQAPSAKRQKNQQLIGQPAVTTSAVVYTDGACTDNGRKDSKGGIGVYWGPNHELNVSMPLEGRQTNNRAEIMAAVLAVQQAKSMGLHEVTVCTDSKFLINGITKWINKWKTNGWKLATGKSVINKEDFQQLDDARQGIDVHFVHVKGHRGNHGNEQADLLARAGVR